MHEARQWRKREADAKATAQANQLLRKQLAAMQAEAAAAGGAPRSVPLIDRRSPEHRPFIWSFGRRRPLSPAEEPPEKPGEVSAAEDHYGLIIVIDDRF
jgi:hypothetical protein